MSYEDVDNDKKLRAARAVKGIDNPAERVRAYKRELDKMAQDESQAQSQAESEQLATQMKAAALTEYVRAHGKSYWVAVLAAFLLGPIGTLYVSAVSGVILMFFTLGMSWGVSPVLGVLGGWFIALLYAPLGVHGVNRQVRAAGKLMLSR